MIHYGKNKAAAKEIPTEEEGIVDRLNFYFLSGGLAVVLGGLAVLFLVWVLMCLEGG